MQSGQKVNTLLIDNNDSFTYNLVQLLRQTGLCDVSVVQAGEVEPEIISRFDRILLSPGPGLPDDFPVLNRVIAACGTTKSILGICLGHQAIALAFGGRLENMRQVSHGLAEEITVTERGHYLFRDVPVSFAGGLYHSWVVADNDFPDALTVTARAGNGRIMALSHREYDVQGLQFHPESVMTPEGCIIIRNWLLGPAVTLPR